MSVPERNGGESRRDADIRDLIAANCPREDVSEFVGTTLRNGGRVILPCTCSAMITTRLDSAGNAVVSHYTTEGKYEASTTIPAGLFGTPEGSRSLHEWIAGHHARTDSVRPEINSSRTP